MKVLTIGGATQDIFLQYDGADVMTINKRGALQNFILFESGEKIEIESLVYHTGGGATNTAVSFSRLGFEATCACVIGDDAAGAMVTADLAHNNVKTRLITVNPKSTTGLSAIINTARGDRTIFAYRGANATLSLNSNIINTISTIQQIYITSLSNQAIYLLPELVAVAKKNTVAVAINPGTSQLRYDTHNLKKSLGFVDTLILNSSEARTFMTALIDNDETYKASLINKTSTTICSLNAPDPAPYLMSAPFSCQNMLFSMPKFFSTILAMGPSIVVVTNGANGVYVATQDKTYFHPSIKTTLVSTVGAGDAFGSCFIASLNLGYSIPDALRNGIINSSSVLTHLGAKTGLLTHEQLKERVKAIPSNLIQIV